MVDASEKKVITLMTSNGDEFEVEKAVAMESQTIRHMIESDCTNNRIPIPNINSKILSKVIEYCNKHVQANPAIDGTAGSAGASTVTTPAAFADDLKNWDAEFVNVDQTTVFNLILAASYLNMKGLMNLTCQTALDMIKGKTSEEIRTNFNFPNDYTPKQKETLLVNNERAFDWKSI